LDSEVESVISDEEHSWETASSSTSSESEGENYLTDSSESEDESEDESNIQRDTSNFMPQWSKTNVFIPQVDNYHAETEKIKNLELRSKLQEQCTPLQLLKFFISDEIVESILNESEKFAKLIFEAKPNAPKISPFSRDEFWIFMGLHMTMGIHKLPQMSHYWCQNKLVNCPIFGENMSRNRFMEILRVLHFSDNKKPNAQNRFWKLDNFFPNLLQKFKSSINPGEYLSLDESLVEFKGRLAFKQYIPSKRCRFGIKFFVVVDKETNFVLDMIAYQGKATDLGNLNQELGIGGAAAFSLVSDFLHKNHKVVTDSWFVSPNLASKLLEHGTHLLGTVKKCRKGMPKLAGKLSKGKVETHSTDRLLVER